MDHKPEVLEIIFNILKFSLILFAGLFVVILLIILAVGMIALWYYSISLWIADIIVFCIVISAILVIGTNLE